MAAPTSEQDILVREPVSLGAGARKMLLPRSLPAAVLMTLAVAALLVGVISGARHRNSPAAREVSLPAGAADLPPAMRLVPADTSAEIRARAIVRRDGFPMLRWDIDEFAEDKDGRMTYKGSADTETGIDVSEHQYDINWKKVAADGIDFAMIRMGYRGSTAGGLYVDDYFEKNVTGALAAGLPVGVYFYSQAITPAEAEEEAEFLLKSIRGYDITYPVVFDWEIVGGEEARTYSLSRRDLVACTRAFCDKVAEAGYEPMIYFTQYLGYRKYILRNLSDYGFWYAQYEPQPHIAFHFDMWQYSEEGTVDGVEGKVDLNILLKER